MRGVFVLVLLFFSVSAASAQSKTENSQPRPGTVRVAVVNVAVVFHKYEKAQAFRQELDTTLAPFKLKAQKLAREMKQWKKSIDDGDGQDDAEVDLHTSIQKNQRELADMEQTIKRLVGQKQEESLVTLWTEVRCAIRLYAAEHGIELVIGYGESLDPELVDLFPNVSRKMHALESGSAIVMFMSPRVDIGDAVATRLNREYREKQAKTAKAKIDLE